MSPAVDRAWVPSLLSSEWELCYAPMHPLLLIVMEGAAHFHACCFVSTSLICTVPATGKFRRNSNVNLT